MAIKQTAKVTTPSYTSFVQLQNRPQLDYSRMVKRIQILMIATLANANGGATTLEHKDYAHNSQVQVQATSGEWFAQGLPWADCELAEQLRKTGAFIGWDECADIVVPGSSSLQITKRVQLVFGENDQPDQDDSCPNLAQIGRVEIKFVPTLPAGLTVQGGQVDFFLVYELQDYAAGKSSVAPIRQIVSTPMDGTNSKEVAAQGLVTHIGVRVKDKTTYDMTDLAGLSIYDDSNREWLSAPDLTAAQLNLLQFGGPWDVPLDVEEVATEAADFAASLKVPGCDYELSELQPTNTYTLKANTNNIPAGTGFICHIQVLPLSPGTIREGTPKSMTAKEVQEQSAAATLGGNPAPDFIRPFLPRKVYKDAPASGIRV